MFVLENCCQTKRLQLHCDLSNLTHDAPLSVNAQKGECCNVAQRGTCVLPAADNRLAQVAQVTKHLRAHWVAENGTNSDAIDNQSVAVASCVRVGRWGLSSSNKRPSSIPLQLLSATCVRVRVHGSDGGGDGGGMVVRVAVMAKWWWRWLWCCQAECRASGLGFKKEVHCCSLDAE
jgi:hypothetical protein